MMKEKQSPRRDGGGVITSRANPAVTAAAALSEKKYRDRDGLFLFEGIKLLRDALASDTAIERVFVREDAYARFARELDGRVPIILVTESVYDKLSEERSPEGVLTVACKPEHIHHFAETYPAENMPRGTKFLASQLRDPGNLGTVIRSANALGIDELIISPDCADLYNRRTVRAAMGALFRQRIVICDIASAVDALAQAGYKVYAAVLSEDAQRLDRMHVGRDTCFLVGNEGHGLDAELAERCGGKVIIPMRPGCESLNAATAASLLMWETGKER